MVAVRTSETSVYSHETTRRYIAEGSSRRENLKSHKVSAVYIFLMYSVQTANGVLWIVTPRILVGGYRRFRGTYCFQVQSWGNFNSSLHSEFAKLLCIFVNKIIYESIWYSVTVETLHRTGLTVVDVSPQCRSVHAVKPFFTECYLDMVKTSPDTRLISVQNRPN
jgi:hypothetical protein